MRRVNIYIIGVLLVSSCKQELCQPIVQSDNSAITLSVDWSQSNIDLSQISNLSIYAYPEDGGLPYMKVSGNLESASLSLPVGSYSLLVFNDIVGDLSGISFSGYDTYSGFCAEVVEQSVTSDMYYDLADDEVLATDHDQFVVWRMAEFEVTSNMVSCPYCELIHSETIELDVIPTALTVQCSFIIRIENLNNAQIIQGVLKGFAAGAYPVSDERFAYSDESVIYSVEFTSATYDDDSTIDGVVEAEITTFGKLADESQTYLLVLDIILNSGERLMFTRDITEQVVEQDNIRILISLESSENLLTLPSYEGTGFGVESWGGGESVDLQ